MPLLSLENTFQMELLVTISLQSELYAFTKSSGGYVISNGCSLGFGFIFCTNLDSQGFKEPVAFVCSMKANYYG